jgi:hypothetical protein
MLKVKRYGCDTGEVFSYKKVLCPAGAIKYGRKSLLPIFSTSGATFQQHQRC